MLYGFKSIFYHQIGKIDIYYHWVDALNIILMLNTEILSSLIKKKLILIHILLLKVRHLHHKLFDVPKTAAMPLIYSYAFVSLPFLFLILVCILDYFNLKQFFYI